MAINTQSITIKIETYWNVNYDMFVSEVDHEKIKIETYWNVNVDVIQTSGGDVYIKIETYWNVNSPLDNEPLLCSTH